VVEGRAKTGEDFEDLDPGGRTQLDTLISPKKKKKNSQTDVSRLRVGGLMYLKLDN